MALNEKQIRFCEEYLVDLNATRAAKAAGYSEKTAYSIGCENMIKPEIQTYLQERRLQIANSLQITQEKVIKEYAKVAFGDIRKFYTIDGALKSIHDLDDDAAGALAGVETYDERVSDPDADETVTAGQTKKIKTYDKIKALDSICKVLGFNAPEKKNVQHNQKILVEVVRKNGTG
jgi:phage terminase small subunit